MVALNTSTHRLLAVPSGGNAGDAVPVDMRVAMERMLADLGFSAFIVANTAPVDKTALWWHKDIKTAKRYDAYNNVWASLAPGQYALHLMQRAVVATSVETAVAADDMFMFYDVSRGEMMKIGRVELAQALMPGQLRLLGSASGAGTHHDITLHGPFKVLTWQATWQTSTPATDQEDHLRAHISSVEGSFPSMPTTPSFDNDFPILMGFGRAAGVATYPGVGSNVGHNSLASNGRSIDYQVQAPAIWGLNRHFSAPTIGQTRYMRVRPYKLAFTSAQIEIWGY